MTIAEQVHRDVRVIERVGGAEGYIAPASGAIDIGLQHDC
ncbi:hypothetical protein SAMCFNEI73_pC1510 (plasmid) [Sinorhizobium americanum]|uniref:Uncharacterized protein n=1 Tax=Sinorhizobium americanum TaxID=194963 RepID=A0A1L3LYR8_9HYPH|nr:hypothetical protein SAMCFNEI73_pC1510 [Sinorhizobium americanum]